MLLLNFQLEDSEHRRQALVKTLQEHPHISWATSQCFKSIFPMGFPQVELPENVELTEDEKSANEEAV